MGAPAGWWPGVGVSPPIHRPRAASGLSIAAAELGHCAAYTVVAVLIP